LYITYDQHKFQQIEAIEVKKCDFKDDLFIEGITSYDEERHHSTIAKIKLNNGPANNVKNLGNGFLCLN
jgi:DNA/RNA endonuclease YhcR with UshA esterase domain